MSCICGAENRPDVWMCEHHAYWKGGARYASVSAVIRAVYPSKSWDDVNPAIIENARERGQRVDFYLSEYIRTGRVTIPVGEREDVKERMKLIVPWWEENVGDMSFQAQRILVDDKNRIAGTADFVGDDTVIDLKNSYSIEKSYWLQLGAYASMAGVSSAGILHVNPKVYAKRGGCKLIPADVPSCVEWWTSAVAWWRSLQSLEAA